MQINSTKLLSPEQEAQISKIWDEEYPVNLTGRFKILFREVKNATHYFIENNENTIIAWVANFERENENWFSIIVSTNYKGKKLGNLLIEKLKSKNLILNGWVIDHENNSKQNGEAYITPLPFYIKLGFEVLANIRIETEIISAVKIRWNK